MMHATAARLGKGFWGRSYEELQRYSRIIWNNETIKGVSGPLPIHDFNSPDKIDDCLLMCDKEKGGHSTAALDWVSPVPSCSSTTHTNTKTSTTTTSTARTATATNSQTQPQPQPETRPYARFHGHISLALPNSRPDIHRSGFAAFRTRDRGFHLFGRGTWDIDMYRFLALRVRSDGRSYLVNVQTESIEPSDLHQHRLFARRPGQWETVLIKWNDFVRTNHGVAVEPQTEMLRRKVRTVGVGLTDRREGAFELCVQGVWATNDEGEAEAEVEGGGRLWVGDGGVEGIGAGAGVGAVGGLRNKRGENVRWAG